MKVTIEIPDTMQDLLRGQPGLDAAQAVKEELAITWYQAEKISIGQVAELLGISIYAAQGLMKRRNVNAPYSVEDFERDRASLLHLEFPNSAGAHTGPAQGNAAQ